jgi:hypothetical protein
VHAAQGIRFSFHLSHLSQLSHLSHAHLFHPKKVAKNQKEREGGMSPKPDICPECSGIKARLKSVEDNHSTFRGDWKNGKDHQSKINDQLFNLHRELLAAVNKIDKKIISVAVLAALGGNVVWRLVEFLVQVLSKGL